jgi:hypothetical protein
VFSCGIWKRLSSAFLQFFCWELDIPPWEVLGGAVRKKLFLAVVSSLVVSGVAAEVKNPAPSDSRIFGRELEPMRLHMTRNRLYNARGDTAWLRGVNIASLEWSNQGEHMSEAFGYGGMGRELKGPEIRAAADGLFADAWAALDSVVFPSELRAAPVEELVGRT